MTGRTFEQWVNAIFDHPVPDDNSDAWYWARESDHCIEQDDLNAEYLVRPFTHCDRLLQKFDTPQVNQGFGFIIHPACSEHTDTISRAPWRVRRSWIRSIYDVYAKCFAGRCVDALSHLDEASMRFNYACYMWWDVFPGWPEPHDPASGECLDVMGRCLTLSHNGCMEGALHGLGHWHGHFPERVESIIDAFLRERKDLRPELIGYALRARHGGVL